MTRALAAATDRKPRRIGFLGFDGVQAMDLVGPADAFGSDAFAELADVHEPPYEVVVIGLTGKRFTSSCGVRMAAHVGADASVKLDTLIVPGGRGLRQGNVAERAAKWIATRAGHIRRVASVCTGIYGLARTGLLDGRDATTHWAAAADVQHRFPKINLLPDSIFVRAGNCYTSAGISAGIDLALSLIEEDLGPHASLAVAREMVVYLKREGGQAQFSEPLAFQLGATNRFHDLAAWISAHLRNDLSVETLAARTNLSPRQFTRSFQREFGTTPASFVEDLRIAEARRRLAASGRRVNIDAVARSVGYSNVDVFRRAFERQVGVAPAKYRSRFGTMPT